MNTKLIPEDFDLAPESEEEVYSLLLRALQRKQGFGLFFVQCERYQGSQQILRILKDLPEKRIEIMEIGRDTTTLYDKVESHWQQKPFDILVVDGLENALYGYESDAKKVKEWTSQEVYSYSWKGVAPILNHLNQVRDKLRNHFPINFVFLVPKYVVTYFLARAADFFDWRSGLFIFPPSAQEESDSSIATKEFEVYQIMPFSEWQKEVVLLKIKFSSSNSEDNLEKAEIAYALGLAYYAKQYYENAVIYWDQAIDLQPEHANAWYSRGLGMKRLGRLQEAIDSYTQALRFQEFYPEVYNNRGLARRSLGKAESAIADYTQAIKQKPDYAIAYNNRGIAYRDLKDIQASIDDYNRATKLKPDYAIAYYNRGNAYKDQGRDLGAEADYTKAIQLKSDDADFYSNRGIVRCRLGDYKGAIADYDQALKLRPEFASAYLGRGMAYSGWGDFPSAITDFDQALKLKLDDADTYYHRGMAYKNLSNRTGAIADLQRAIDSYPENNPWRQKAIDEVKTFHLQPLVEPWKE
jgi:tetratricopeptide (TPR) repeat protein